MTKQELIELIKEKQKNARIDFERHLYTKDAIEKSNELERANLVGDIRTYDGIIVLLESTEIVNDTLCPTCKDKDTCYHKARSGKEAVKCTEYNPVTKADGNVVERVKNEEKYKEEDPKVANCTAEDGKDKCIADCENCKFHVEGTPTDGKIIPEIDDLYYDPDKKEWRQAFPPKPKTAEPPQRYLYEIRRILRDPEIINGVSTISVVQQIISTEEGARVYIKDLQDSINTYSVQIKSRKEIF